MQKRIPKEVFLRMRRRHRGYRVLLLVQVGFLMLLPVADRHPWMISLMLIVLSIVIVSEVSRFSPLKSRRQSFYLLGGIAIGMEILWHLLLQWRPLLGIALTVPHVIVWTAFLVLALTRMVLTLMRERYVTSAVVLGAAAGYLLIGVAGGVLLGALWVLHPSSIELIRHPLASSAQDKLELLGLSSLNVAPTLMSSAFNLLTTVGTPLVNLRDLSSQVVTTFITVTGQLYVAILIGLVLGRFHKIHR